MPTFSSLSSNVTDSGTLVTRLSGVSVAETDSSATAWTNRTSRRGSVYDFWMDFCDLIFVMEHAEISPRPAVGAIVLVSGLAVSFLKAQANRNSP
jgi:hypothetical protein